MAGSKGKGKASTSKSKPKNLALVAADPEPLMSTIKECADNPLDGEEGNNEIPSKEVDEKATDEVICQQVGNGNEEEQFPGEENAEEMIMNIHLNEISFNIPDDFLKFGETEENPVEVNDGGDAANNADIEEDEDNKNEEDSDEVSDEGDAANNADVDDKEKTNEDDSEEVSDEGDASNNADVEGGEEKINEEDPEEVSNEGGAAIIVDVLDEEEEEEEETDEDDLEELSDGGGEANNVDVKDNEEEANEEVPAEDKEEMNNGFGGKDIHTEEKRKSSQVATEGMVVTNEGLTASEHQIVGENMTDDLQYEREATRLNTEKPMETLADNGNVECARADASVVNNVKEVPEKASRPKRKVLRKKVVKKPVLRKDVASVNEATPQSSIGNDALGEFKEVDTNKHVNNEEKAEIKPPVNRKPNSMGKKKVAEGHAGIAASGDEPESLAIIDEPRNEENKETNKEDVKSEEAAKSGVKMSRGKKRRMKKAAQGDSNKGVPVDVNKTAPSQKSKSSKKVDSMGMIFMCSSETKKDCYDYKVLGLPAGKKDLVLKIYKGMRLFLFDVELRMMYGIYKAAGPGGFNIEPRAFKSQFPSQVRFTVLDERKPLPEEKFKTVIKENYYSKNKFNCQLNREQVKNLCQLFNETSKKKADTKRVAKAQTATPSSSARKDRKRKRVDDTRRVGPIPSARQDKKRKRVDDARRGGPIPSSKRGRTRRRAEEDVRRRPVVVDDRYYQRPVVYQRETYLPSAAPVALYQPLPPPSPPPRPSSYSYGRSSRADIYRRDSALDHRDRDRELGLSSLRELRHHPVETHHRDAYVSSYREPRAYHHSAYEAAYETDSRRDYYETHRQPEVYDYSSDRRRVEYYRPTEYRPPLPPYRRY